LQIAVRPSTPPMGEGKRKRKRQHAHTIFEYYGFWERGEGRKKKKRGVVCGQFLAGGDGAIGGKEKGGKELAHGQTKEARRKGKRRKKQSLFLTPNISDWGKREKRKDSLDRGTNRKKKREGGGEGFIRFEGRGLALIVSMPALAR